MGIDLAKYPTDEKYCELCGLVHSYGKRCGAMTPAFDFKMAVGKCPHCKTTYLRDTTEPVEVYVPWENRLVWRSCWACFIKKLEG